MPGNVQSGDVKTELGAEVLEGQQELGCGEQPKLQRGARTFLGGERKLPKGLQGEATLCLETSIRLNWRRVKVD